MPSPSSQDFLKEFDKKFCSNSGRLPAKIDAAVYRHAVLGQIFLKYVSDSYAARQKEIEIQLRDPKSDRFLDAADFKSADNYGDAGRLELENRDYFRETNVFWAPSLARWKTLQDSANLIDLVATIPFEYADPHAKDILGNVYEYFRGQFVPAEGMAPFSSRSSSITFYRAASPLCRARCCRSC